MMSFVKYLAKIAVLNKGLGGLSVAAHRSVYTEWKTQVESGKYPSDFRLPWISIVSKNFLIELLSRKAANNSRVFEYGSGGSSLFFLKYAGEVVSVEHDREWFDLVKKIVQDEGVSGWNGNWVEPEFVGDRSQGLDKANPKHYYTEDVKFQQHTFQRYASFIDSFPDNHFDLVLVDGRSRPSCIFHSTRKIKPGGLLVVDNAERPYYLSQDPFNGVSFELLHSAWGAVICTPQFSRTFVYRRK